jgi:hypothetical protein
MCQFFPSIKYLDGQVFVRVPLFVVMTLISVARSFVGGNVHGKWLQTVMAIIKMEKCLRVMSPSKLSRFSFCLRIQTRLN